MTRTVLALVLLTLLAPTLAADATLAAFDSAQGCRAAGVPLDLPDCAVTQDGEATLVSCDGSTCTVSFAFAASASGLPPGAQSLEAAVVADEREVLCGASALTAFGSALACDASGEVTVAVPGACRLFVVATTVTVDGAVSGSAFSELRVCRDGSLTTP